MDSHHFLPIFVLLLATHIQGQMNVLFITVDDLRPELGAYTGKNFVHPDIHTPNIDSLASKSLLLKNNYVQQALCGPSRTSLLTSRRPETTKVHNNQRYFREVGGNFTTLPQYFKNNGYISLNFGKIFHPGDSSNGNDPMSWSEEPYIPPCSWSDRRYSWMAVTPEETEDCPLPDVSVASEAISNLRRFEPGGDLEGKNFFIGVGFYKPHLPFTFPEMYLDHYPLQTISLPANPYAPIDMPDIAWTKPVLLLQYDDIKELNFTGEINETLPEDKAIDLRRAYYSCVSHIDDEVGRVLNELDRLGMTENTIVSFLGDHGFKIGEHGGWGKMCNFDITVNAPLMIHIPGLTDNGIIAEELTELVDVFPSLVEAAGLPLLELCPEDSADIDICTEGTSLISLLKRKRDNVWKTKVFSQYPRNSDTVMGYSMRTEQFRYTEWPSFDGVSYEPNWDQINGVELYDHSVDPYENHNVAADPEYAELVANLSSQLREGWRGGTRNGSPLST